MKILNEDFYIVLSKYPSGNTGLMIFKIKDGLDENNFIGYSDWSVLSNNLLDNKNGIESYLLPQSKRHIWVTLSNEHPYCELVFELLKGGFIELSGNAKKIGNVLFEEAYLKDELLQNLKNSFFNE